MAPLFSGWTLGLRVRGLASDSRLCVFQLCGKPQSPASCSHPASLGVTGEIPSPGSPGCKLAHVHHGVSGTWFVRPASRHLPSQEGTWVHTAPSAVPAHSGLSTKARLYNAADIKLPSYLAALSFSWLPPGCLHMETLWETLEMIFHTAALEVGPLVSGDTMQRPFFSVHDLRASLILSAIRDSW